MKCSRIKKTISDFIYRDKSRLTDRPENKQECDALSRKRDIDVWKEFPGILFIQIWLEKSPYPASVITSVKTAGPEGSAQTSNS